MEFFKQNSKIDFMGARRVTAAITVVLFALSIASLATKGLKWGLDFTGGTQIQVEYAQPVDPDAIRQKLTGAGFKEAQVVSYGTTKDLLITLPPRSGLDQTRLVDAVMAALPGAQKQSVEFIGPQVGQELATKGALAIVVALLSTMVYIAFRFEYRFAVSAAAALIHDPVLILGIFSFWQMDFDLKVLAAILAVIGYSLNDTIVIFDRVRENFRRVRKLSTTEIMNLSINQTLSRTIMTSVSTLLVVVALFLYGGEIIHGFSLALMIGIVVGTYSSIYVAGVLAVFFGLDRKDFVVSTKATVDDKP